VQTNLPLADLRDQTHDKRDLYMSIKRDPQKRCTKLIYTKDLRKRPTKETYRKDLLTIEIFLPQKPPLAELRDQSQVKKDLYQSKETNKRDQYQSKETYTRNQPTI